MSSTIEIEIPEFLNIGVACTSAHVGTAKENNTAMIIEDEKLGTDEITYKDLATKSDQVANFLGSIGILIFKRLSGRKCGIVAAITVLFFDWKPPISLVANAQNK